MANHKSSLKRIRQDKKKAEHNHYYAKTMRNAVRKLRAMTDKDEATKLYPTVQKMLDKLAKNNIIHKNKAANIKSSLCKKHPIRLKSIKSRKPLVRGFFVATNSRFLYFFSR